MDESECPHSLQELADFAFSIKYPRVNIGQHGLCIPFFCAPISSILTVYCCLYTFVAKTA